MSSDLPRYPTGPQTPPPEHQSPWRRFLECWVLPFWQFWFDAPVGENKLTRFLRLMLAGGVAGYAVVFFVSVAIACVMFRWGDKEWAGLVNGAAFILGPIGGVAGLVAGFVVACILVAKRTKRSQEATME